MQNQFQNNQHILMLKAIRIVVLFWLVGWWFKIDFLKHYLLCELKDFPILNNHFPLFFQSVAVAQCFYVLPIFALIVFLRGQRFYFILTSVIMLCSSTVLMLHQDFHNDATFVTSWWVSLWLLWFSSYLGQNKVDVLIHAQSLALWVVGLIFAGGFFGKLTPEYWNGEVLAQIFLQQDYGFLGNWIRAHVDAETIRWYFQWISKGVILSEGFLSLSPFLPYRVVCWVGIPFMLSISFFTTWMIFSVLFCLIGLLLAGRILNACTK